MIDTLCPPDSSLVDLIEAVRALPYGRPGERTVEGMLRERRGSCSTKHLFLAQALAERFPETEPQIVHRVYKLDHASAIRLFGPDVSEVVPEDGLIDVHRYVTIVLNGQRLDRRDVPRRGVGWSLRASACLQSRRGLPGRRGPGRGQASTRGAALRPRGP